MEEQRQPLAVGEGVQDPGELAAGPGLGDERAVDPPHRLRALPAAQRLLLLGGVTAADGRRRPFVQPGVVDRQRDGGRALREPVGAVGPHFDGKPEVDHRPESELRCHGEVRRGELAECVTAEHDSVAQLFAVAGPVSAQVTDVDRTLERDVPGVGRRRPRAAWAFVVSGCALCDGWDVCDGWEHPVSTRAVPSAAVRTRAMAVRATVVRAAARFRFGFRVRSIGTTPRGRWQGDVRGIRPGTGAVRAVRLTVPLWAAAPGAARDAPWRRMVGGPTRRAVESGSGSGDRRPPGTGWTGVVAAPPGAADGCWTGR